MLKILTNNCDRGSINYIPARDLWLKRLYFSMLNGSKYSCLTIDFRNSGPAKYRTNVESNFEQFCYYPQKRKDKLFNKFLAKGTAQDNETTCFEIDSMVSASKNSKTKFHKAFDELESLVKSQGGSNLSEQFNKQNGRGRGKNRRRPRFLS